MIPTATTINNVTTTVCLISVRRMNEFPLGFQSNQHSEVADLERVSVYVGCRSSTSHEPRDEQCQR